MEKDIDIVVLDDNRSFAMLLAKKLENFIKSLGKSDGKSYAVSYFSDTKKCLSHFKDRTVLAFVDYHLDHGLNGSLISRYLRMKHKDCYVVIISQKNNWKSAIKAVKEGAIDYLIKDDDIFDKCNEVFYHYKMGKLSHHLT